MVLFEMVDSLNLRWDCPTPAEAAEWAQREADMLEKLLRMRHGGEMPTWLLSWSGELDQRGRPYVDALVSDWRRLQELPRTLGGIPVAARVKREANPLCKQRQADLGDLAGECAPLPSGQAMDDLVGGDPSALGRVLGHTFLRATLIGAGMMAVGARRGTVVRDAIAGSLGIDAFVAAWALWNRSRA